ncbi:IclR family transcriptional regulator [Novosphingobium huizhouense]|uniref:IclR family transcriptional regulator n=1 Tax=Novosphingobium huizhouense TaxID=2866625 RepID=UPI001CD86FD0|nr:helix-turn-helix domain-containing protein [Novosphingobium huizhouense]
MPGPVRSVSQAFAILRLLSVEGPLTLSEVVRETGLSPSSGLNLLRTLVAEGICQREIAGKRYRLAEGWAQAGVLGDSGPSRRIAAARPALARFAREHDTATGLWQVVSNERLALVALGESGEATRIHMVEGQRQPIGGGSTGRALAASAGLDHAELVRRFSKVRWRRRIDLAAWVEQIARAQSVGYAIDDGFNHPGICSVSATVPPGPGEGGAVQFCVSASIFAGSRSDREIEALGRALVDLAQGPALCGRDT